MKYLHMNDECLFKCFVNDNDLHQTLINRNPSIHQCKHIKPLINPSVMHDSSLVHQCKHIKPLINPSVMHDSTLVHQCKHIKPLINPSVMHDSSLVHQCSRVMMSIRALSLMIIIDLNHQTHNSALVH